MFAEAAIMITHAPPDVICEFNWDLLVSFDAPFTIGKQTRVRPFEEIGFVHCIIIPYVRGVPPSTSEIAHWLVAVPYS